MPVKIFSGVDYVVERSVNRFAKDVKVVDVRISTHVHGDKPQVTVLVLYEGTPPAHAAGPGLV